MMNQNLSYKSIEAAIFNLKFWIKNIEPQEITPIFEKLLKDTEFGILNFSEHHFPVKGYTALWLLAESHLAIHTFPDNNYTYVELSGCNEDKTENFRNKIKEYKDTLGIFQINQTEFFNPNA
ncbi:MAG: S-adenosylmethionine decarboxylase [Mesonia sp.]|uniref:S-adenosylmethionine decarboxylase family protein n=1 Tax=Mesonia sp. TaxID=1960830 RepID=UPI0032421FA5